VQHGNANKKKGPRDPEGSQTMRGMYQEVPRAREDWMRPGVEGQGDEPR